MSKCETTEFLGLMYDNITTTALISGLITEGDADMLTKMNTEDLNGLERGYRAMIAALKRDMLRKRLEKGAELIANAKDEKQRNYYQRVFAAIEKQYNKEDETCQNLSK